MVIAIGLVLAVLDAATSVSEHKWTILVAGVLGFVYLATALWFDVEAASAE